MHWLRERTISRTFASYAAAIEFWLHWLVWSANGGIGRISAGYWFGYHPGRMKISLSSLTWDGFTKKRMIMGNVRVVLVVVVVVVFLGCQDGSQRRIKIEAFLSKLSWRLNGLETVASSRGVKS